jgi:hypothetical protein
MSISTQAQGSPRVPWLFLGGLFTIFIGFGISYLGGFFFNGGRDNLPPPNKFPYLGWITLGIIVFALGSFLLASMDRVRGADLSLVAVAFIMMPLPSLVSYLINYLGNYLRRTASTTAQVVLIAAGVFLIALAANWAWDLHQARVVRVDFQAFAWPILADFGVVSLLLAFLPMLVPEEPVVNPVGLEVDEASE